MVATPPISEAIMRNLNYHGLWIGLLLLDITALAMLPWLTERPFSRSLHTSHFALGLLVTALAAAPMIRFLVIGWGARYEEFRNRLNNGALVYYLRQFWQPRTDKHPQLSTWPLPENEEVEAAAEQLFEQIYREHYGRAAFLTPMLLMLIATLCMSVLYLLAVNDQLTLPFDAQIVCAAIAGAYLFVVSDMVLSVRKRSLNVADVYWYALRMMLAIPIGAAVSAAGAAETVSAAQTVSAFAVGAFPMDTLFKLLRRLVALNLNAKEQPQENDQLIQLEGVTANISAALAAEGVNSIEQLVCIDPVLLSIRTGFPFKFVLRLGSQAIVWRHFGQHAAVLSAMGLADAPAIVTLNEMLKKEAGSALRQQADNVIADIVARLQAKDGVVLSADTVKFNFRQVGKENYTRFLMAAQKQGGHARPPLRPVHGFPHAA